LINQAFCKRAAFGTAARQEVF